MMAIGKPGMQVQIFQKPLTAEDPEGIATLVKLIKGEETTADGSNIARWQVRFPGDERTYPRRMRLRQVTREPPPWAAPRRCQETHDALPLWLVVPRVPDLEHPGGRPANRA